MSVEGEKGMIPERTLAYRPMPCGKGQTYDAKLGQSRTDCGQTYTEQIAERHLYVAKSVQKGQSERYACGARRPSLGEQAPRARCTVRE